MKRAYFDSNKHIVRLLDVSEDEKKAYLILKYYKNGDLEKYLETHQLTEQQALLVFSKICIGYNWFIENKVIHRDLKPLKILMDGDEPVICDLGSSRKLEGELELALTNKLFTVSYMAPEQLSPTKRSQDKNYDRTVDIWALDVILYELIHHKHPFKADSAIKMQASIVESEPSYPSCSKETADLLSRLLKKNPEARIPCELLEQDCSGIIA